MTPCEICGEEFGFNDACSNCLELRRYIKFSTGLDFPGPKGEAVKHTTHDIDNEGSIGMDLIGCGLEAEDCKCDAALADEELEGEEE